MLTPKASFQKKCNKLNSTFYSDLLQGFCGKILGADEENLARQGDDFFEASIKNRKNANINLQKHTKIHFARIILGADEAHRETEPTA